MSHFLSRWWYQLTKAKQSSSRPPEEEPHIHFVHVSREEDLFQPFQVVSNKLGKTLLVHSQPSDATIHTSSDILSTQYKVPRAQFMRYPMPTNYDDYIEKYRGNADHAVMRDMLAELEHYRANVKGYEEIEALFWLAARDLVFFGTWDEEVHDWTGGFSMALNVNDTFYYASADAQALNIQNTPHLKELHEKFGFGGIAAWVALERNEEVLPALNNLHFQQAKAYILEKGWFPKPDK